MKLNFLRMFLMCFIVALVGANMGTLSRSALAQVLDLKSIKEIPTYLGAMDHDTFVALTMMQTDIPLDDKSMSYEVRLPKAWTKNVEVSTGMMTHVSDKVLGEIVRYYSPSDLYTISRFTVTALQLDNQITARNWFLNHVMTQGYVLQGMKVYSDNEVEGLYVLIEKDTSYSVRSKAVINGSRIFLISYYIPYQNWAKDSQLRAMQERGISSFKFTSPETNDLNMSKNFRFLNAVDFDYPSAWNIYAPNIFSTDGMRAKLSNASKGQTLEGLITVNIVSTESSSTISQEIRNLKDDLKQAGFRVDKVLEEDDGRRYVLAPDIYFNRIEKYSAEGVSKNTLEHEYWVAVMVEDSYFYIVTLLTPSRLNSFYTWAINSEAFETVIQSIGPVDVFIDYQSEADDKKDEGDELGELGDEQEKTDE